MSNSSTTPIALAIVAAAALIAGAVVLTSSKHQEKSLPDPYKDLKEAVANQLFDPGSAIFKHIEKKVLGYCGEVNAKNKFGGYVGFKRFYIFKTTDGKWEITYFPDLIKIECG